MSDTLYALIKLLADGCFHSGEALGRALGLSRAAVWKSLKFLPELGLELHAVHGRGYRLSEPLELLDTEAVVSKLTSGELIEKFELFLSIDSTSLYLKQLAEQGAPSGTVCLAESQTMGRGRRGRIWHSPFGSNIYLSILWRFNNGMASLGGLSLVVAVAMMRAFNQLGASGLGIKWPNDIVSDHGKVAGILVDVAGESSGPCYAVIGVGVNCTMQENEKAHIDQPWSTLRQASVTADRNEITATLLDNILRIVDAYQMTGFAPFRDEWQQQHKMHDQEVELQMGDSIIVGMARGCDENGLLLLEHDGAIRHYAAGEVSLRKVTP